MAPSTAIETASARSPLVREALETARRAHDRQFRDDGGGERPFLAHLLEVADLLAAEGHREEVIAAALLHDTVESTDLDPASIRSGFGEAVTDLVGALTERPDIEPYVKRKEDLRARVAAAGAEAQAIYAADKLSNVRALREGYRVVGEKVDRSLKVPLDEKLSVWRRDLEMLQREAGETPLVAQLAGALAGLVAERR